MKARWWHIAGLVAGSLLVAASIACAGSSANPSPTPTASATPRPIPTPTVVPSSAGLLDGWQIYVWVISGCECPPPPAAGLIDVQLFPPETASEHTPLKWRVGHPSLPHPIEMPMVHEMLSLETCAPKDASPPVVQAVHAWYRIPMGEGLPSGPGFDVSILVRDHAGKEFWVRVQPTKICSAVS